MSETIASTYWAPCAWLAEGWAERVLLRVGGDGCWSEVAADVATPPEGATVLAGPVLPGLVDAHSHAFQRAFAGLAERREAGREHDDFWSWRERMYAVAQRVTPEQLRAIAAQLFVELLGGGYTQVCEFHYLQHRVDGTPYADDPLALSWALADAAADAGIGLTVLPVLYERAGFAADSLGPSQRRFALDADGAWRASRRIVEARRPLLEAGLAIHSLRAAAAASIARLRLLAEGFDGPIHIHVAEQQREVDDCLGATGQRPVQWLAAQPGGLDPRWQLVHATHVMPAEIDAVGAAGAGVVLCPGTEANLGDGLTDLPGWLARDGVALSIGSDSNVTRSWPEELRLLEYGQRLLRRERNVAAGIERGRHRASSAERLWSRALDGGAAAAFGSRGKAGIARGCRADLLVVEPRDPALLGVPPDHGLDALVFSSPVRPWRDVMVAGRWVVRDGTHPGGAAIAGRFETTMTQLWRED